MSAAGDSECVSEGSVISRMFGERLPRDLEQVRLEHPSGAIEVALARTGADGETIRAAVIRTARRLFSGEVYVPAVQRLAG